MAAVRSPRASLRMRSLRRAHTRECSPGRTAREIEAPRTQRRGTQQLKRTIRSTRQRDRAGLSRVRFVDEAMS